MHTGKKSLPWLQSLQKAAGNVYVRAGKSMGTLMVGMMMDGPAINPLLSALEPSMAADLPGGAMSSTLTFDDDG